jgi:hypothetical protein
MVVVEQVVRPLRRPPLRVDEIEGERLPCQRPVRHAGILTFIDGFDG